MSEKYLNIRVYLNRKFFNNSLIECLNIFVAQKSKKYFYQWIYKRKYLLVLSSRNNCNPIVKRQLFLYCLKFSIPHSCQIQGAGLSLTDGGVRRETGFLLYDLLEWYKDQGTWRSPLKGKYSPNSPLDQTGQGKN